MLRGPAGRRGGGGLLHGLRCLVGSAVAARRGGPGAGRNGGPGGGRTSRGSPCPTVRAPADRRSPAPSRGPRGPLPTWRRCCVDPADQGRGDGQGPRAGSRQDPALPSVRPRAGGQGGRSRAGRHAGRRGPGRRARADARARRPTRSVVAVQPPGRSAARAWPGRTDRRGPSRRRRARPGDRDGYAPGDAPAPRVGHRPPRVTRDRRRAGAGGGRRVVGVGAAPDGPRGGARRPHERALHRRRAA